MQRAQRAWLQPLLGDSDPGFRNRIKALASKIGFIAETERLYGGYALKAYLAHPAS